MALTVFATDSGDRCVTRSHRSSPIIALDALDEKERQPEIVKPREAPDQRRLVRERPLQDGATRVAFVRDDLHPRQPIRPTGAKHSLDADHVHRRLVPGVTSPRVGALLCPCSQG